MQKSLALRLLVDVVFFTTYGLLFLFYPLGFSKNYNHAGSVHINNEGGVFQLYRNGQPFYIKGAAGISHFNDLGTIGGNTIRVYDTLNLLAVLNEAEKNNLAVIVDIPLPNYNEKYSYYKDQEMNNVRKAKVRHLVRRFRNHPALLFWNLGNELYYPIKLFPNDFIKAFNELIDIIHTEDPDHLVGTAVLGRGRISKLSMMLHSPKLDLVGYNIFGKIKDIRSSVFFNSVMSGSFPYYISEWGIDGNWETPTTKWGASIEPTSTKKNEQLRDRYVNHVINVGDNCLGNLVFYWGQKHECTYTWFNMYAEEGKKTEMVATMNDLWKGRNEKQPDIGLEYMLVDGLGAPSSILLSPGTLTKAELKLNKNHKEGLVVRWELYPDHCNLKGIRNEIKEPKRISKAIVSNKGLTALFETPKAEGPYRLYAYLEDQDGYVASCNTPFYVLNGSDE
ncbi:glycoside hydrolase family 2 TIM barrel-domain containing protein [Maribacter luteus]|uniref:glycoside hydrolase family 2 TIM barrel-domain containing protein n=1 Tax=Maribacter luteus TaxID=2594478 RepID=UPI00249162B6|nr:glycoside hydrolase family 2 TIM barrel-domain containing protein [Maribacter luteus]